MEIFETEYVFCTQDSLCNDNFQVFINNILFLVSKLLEFLKYEL